MILKAIKFIQICIICLFLQIFSSTNLFGQIISNVTKYSICQWNRATKTEFDCEKKFGQIMFTKIEVIPNKKILTTFVKGLEIVEYPWDKSKVRMNEDKTLYIYDLLQRDLNFEGGLMIVVFFRLNFTIQLIKIISNIEGTIISTTLYTDN